jgi:hypothetical protein
MNRKKILSILCATLTISLGALAADKSILHWDFDDKKDLSFQYGEEVP